MTSAVKQVLPAGDSLHLVQITDTHLKETPGGRLVGMDTDHSLEHVIDLVRRERAQLDLVLGTGDISDHGSEAAYLRAQAYFARLEAPVAWLPGNHDSAESMQQVLAADEGFIRAVDAGHWRIVLLNSQIPGEVGGELGPDELAWLEQNLAAASAAGQHCLVCLHHQPVPMGSAWIDEQMVADREALFAVLDAHECVRGLLWGHVHQQLDSERNGVKLMSSPSSCIQFAPNSFDFKIDDQPPGYRWLALHADGTIDTGVSRVLNASFDVDLDSSGYL
ncbi:MAG: 3',5'-cyclic-AMP phosphodiesterase [Halieaceae bacterium]|jgi:Icc protein|nr:3',5'-cyclic-AMP phosphodiesterase [Halieaceae bacterium]